MKSIEQEIQSLANDLGVNADIIKRAAESCAAQLAKWYGSDAAAADALREDPVGNAEIAIIDYASKQQMMAVKAYRNPEFTKTIYDMVTAH